MRENRKTKHQSNRETRASKEPWLLQFGSMLIATIPYALFLWFFVVARHNFVIATIHVFLCMSVALGISIGIIYLIDKEL